MQDKTAELARKDALIEALEAELNAAAKIGRVQSSVIARLCTAFEGLGFEANMSTDNHARLDALLDSSKDAHAATEAARARLARVRGEEIR